MKKKEKKCKWIAAGVATHLQNRVEYMTVVSRMCVCACVCGWFLQEEKTDCRSHNVLRFCVWACEWVSVNQWPDESLACSVTGRVVYNTFKSQVALAFPTMWLQFKEAWFCTSFSSCNGDGPVKPHLHLLHVHCQSLYESCRQCFVPRRLVKGTELLKNNFPWLVSAWQRVLSTCNNKIITVACVKNEFDTLGATMQRSSQTFFTIKYDIQYTETLILSWNPKIVLKKSVKYYFLQVLCTPTSLNEAFWLIWSLCNMN